jgi:hypothetical protein
MKTTKLLLVSSIALALTLSFWSATAVEKGSARGGATDLIPATAPATAVTDAVVMACPKCKSEWLVKTDRFARGVTKPTYSTEKHLCAKCSTELTLVGTGKQAKNIPTHLCTACGR